MMNPFYSPSSMEGGGGSRPRDGNGNDRSSSSSSNQIQMIPSYLHPDRQRLLFLPTDDVFDQTMLQLQQQQRARESEFKLSDLAIPAGIAVLTTGALVASQSPLVMDPPTPSVSSSSTLDETPSSSSSSSPITPPSVTPTPQHSTRTNLVKLAACAAVTTVAVYGFHRYVVKPHVLPRLKSWIPGSSSSSSSAPYPQYSSSLGSFPLPY